MRLRLGLLVFFLVIFCSRTVFGQALVDGAVVNGNQFEPVPGVTVHLVNKSLKPEVDRQTVTTAEGRYSFDDVVPAEGYAVDVYDSTGKLVGTDIRFNVAADSKHTAAPDIDISKGITEERARKSGGLIENDRGVSPGANISNEQLRLLPLYNRTFLALGLIQAGVHDVQQGSPLQGAAFSIAGSPSTSTYFLLDGVDNIASSTNPAIPFQVNEAVREFRVTYATPDLRYGQGAGGVVDVITSNGSVGTKGSSWHGGVFGFFNNNSLNANNPISVYSNSGFFKAAAYANGVSPYSNVISDQAPSSPAQPTCLAATGIFCAYSPQSYNALANLVGATNNYGLDTGCATALCQAGLFNPTSVLATQNSFLQPINSEQFGASVGGPIGDRLFIFLSYEGTLIDNPNPIFERVPTFLDSNVGGLALNGADSTVAQQTLRLFPSANVGQVGSGDTALAGTNTGVLGFYRGQAPNYTHVHNVQLRPDLSLKRYGTLSFRYTGQLLDQLHDDTLPEQSSYPGNGAYRRAQNQSAAVTHTLQFGKNLNVLNLAFTQYRVDDVAQDHGFNASNAGLPAGAMPTVVISGIDSRTTGAAPGTPGLLGGWYDSFWQTCAATGVACSGSSAGATNRSPSPITPSLDGTLPFARLGAPLSAPSKNRDTEAFFSDLLDLQLGGHNNLSLGGDYRYQQNFSYEGGQARGLIVANNIGEFTSDSETCVSCGTAFQHPSFDYELRQPAGYTGDLRSSSFGAFAEEKFQPTKNITLEAGGRYEYYGQPLDTQNRLWNYNVTNQGLNRQGATGTFDAFDYQCGGGTTFFDSVYGALRSSTPAGGWNCNTAGTFQLPSNKQDLSGLLGLSISPHGKDVFRASFGGYYDHLPASYNEKLLQDRPSPYDVADPSAIYGQNFGSSHCPQAQCGLGLSTLNYGNLSPAGTATFQNYQAASSANILYERDPNALKTPYLVQFAASYQHRFSGSWTGELAYVGSSGHRLPVIYDGNYANEFYCSQDSFCNNDTYFPVFTESHIGQSNYNSLIARVEGRLWHGLSMHASYTYAKSLDDVVGSTFPTSTDSIFTQLYGRQLYGLGNPAVFALQHSSSGFGSNGALRSTELFSPSFDDQVLQSANIPSFDSVQSALTTTGSRVVNVSHYSLPQNPLLYSSSGIKGREDYGLSDFDVRQRGVADFVYTPSVRNVLLRNIVVSGITTVQTGQPFSIFSGPAYGQITQLADVASVQSVHMTGKPSGYISIPGLSPANNLPSIINTTTCPSLYAQGTLYKPTSTPGACSGNSGRNSFTGPAFFSQDLAVQKSIHPLGEGRVFTFRAEFYNVTNRANYYNPISEISQDGVHINPEFGLIRSAHDPFEIQFAVRYAF